MKIIFPILCLLLFSCGTEVEPSRLKAKKSKKTRSAPAFLPETDAARIARLKAKAAAGTPLVVHVFVPLCDNDHQGIVKVNASLGDGLNLRTNLYWGAGYGVKWYLKSQPDWKLLKSVPDPDENILERIVLKKNYAGATVYLVADAYRGDRMRNCLDDYFDALRGISGSDEISLDDGTKVPMSAQADLLVFNGHNGLMDMELTEGQGIRTVATDAAVIACASYSYFVDPVTAAGANPVLNTTGLLAPEAYVLLGVVNAWAAFKSGEEIRLAAGDAYNSIQKCGVNGARNLFRTGQ